MPTPEPAASSGSPPTERIIADPVIAAVAARAALDSPGVVRLETAVAGLLRQLRHHTVGRVAGITPAPTAGVTVHRDESDVRVRISLAVSGDRPVVAVAERVRQRVADAVRTATGVRLAAVEVAVLAIEPTTSAARTASPVQRPVPSPVPPSVPSPVSSRPE